MKTMMTSELIAALQREVAEHGDKPVAIEYSTDGGEDIWFDGVGDIQTINGQTNIYLYD